MTLDEATITCAPFTAQTVVITGDGGRALLTIRPNGTVEGEIEDASEAARRFVEYVRLMMAPPKTVTVTVVSAYDRKTVNTFKINPAEKTYVRPDHSMFGYVFEPEGSHADD